jgi:FKBP-type peptidyl-prolyl cis-trans isomerase
MRYIFLIGMLLVVGASSVAAQTPVTITPHGYRFQHHVQNKGPKAAPSSRIQVHVSTFVADSLLQTTRGLAPKGRNVDMPTASQFAAAKVPVLFEAASLMAKGDSATIFMPVDSFILRMLPPKYQAEKEIRYEVVLLDIFSADDVGRIQAKADERARQVGARVMPVVADYRAGKLNNALTTTESGLKLKIEALGKGDPIRQQEVVRVHYFGCLTNGTAFDNSYQRGEPLEFGAGMGMVIPGLDEAILALRHGARAYIFIPPSLGYGDQPAPGGQIPPNSELVFYIEIL